MLPTLTQASAWFNTSVFTDAYGTTTFEGQLLTFSDSTRSGASTRRRILEVESSVVIPEKRTVTSVSGTTYVIAEGSEDIHDNVVLRKKYPVVPTDDVFTLRTVEQTLLGTGGDLDIYAVAAFTRGVSVEDQSDFYGGYEVFFSSYFSAQPGQIFSNGSSYYRCKTTSRTDTAGFQSVEVVELEDPIQSLDFGGSSAFDPVTDTYTSVSVSDVTCIVEHIQLDFVHEALGYKKLEAGDRAIAFLKSEVSACSVGDSIGSYEIISVDSNTAYWQVHGRKV